VSSVNKKILTIDPRVIKLKSELLEKYKDQLDDQNIRIKIEDALIKLDKEILLKDPETAIFAGSKTFNVHRTKMFLNFGSVESPDPQNKDLIFVESNLDNGLNKEELPVLFNEVRTGISGRALNTAKGGAATKEVVRFLNKTSIVENDCKTKRTVKIRVTPTNKDIVLFRNIVDGEKLVVLTNENISKYINKTVQMRSPMLCESKTGFCYKCCSYIWEIKELDVLNVIPISISSTIMMLSMKKQHGIKQSIMEITSLNEFIV